MDGKCGVGKTFFISNCLMEKIQQEIRAISRYEGIIYMLLYGIKDIIQIEHKNVKTILVANEDKMAKI